MYEVQVITYEYEYASQTYDLYEALLRMAEANNCDNVLSAVLVDCSTGEVLLQTNEEHNICYISGVGDL